MMHWYGWGGEYGMGHGWGWIPMILFWIFLLAAVFLLIKTMAGRSDSGVGRTDTAEDILKKRFARGEITREEYEEALQVIKK